MPNHVTNIIKASSTVLGALRGKEDLVDFNSIIPCPESLNNVILDRTEDAVDNLFKELENEPLESENVFKKFKIYTIRQKWYYGSQTLEKDSKTFKNFIQMLQNKREYGFVGWYDFNCTNWGTKWNAYDIVAIECGIQFDTAWSAPHPVIKKLAEMFPNEKIEHLWADEDIGNNLGHRIYFRTTFQDKPIFDKIDFALTIKGDDREYYWKNPETELWEYKEG